MREAEANVNVQWNWQEDMSAHAGWDPSAYRGRPWKVTHHSSLPKRLQINCVAYNKATRGLKQSLLRINFNTSSIAALKEKFKWTSAVAGAGNWITLRWFISYCQPRTIVNQWRWPPSPLWSHRNARSVIKLSATIASHYTRGDCSLTNKIYRLLILSLAPGTAAAAVVVKVLCQL